MSLLPLRRCLDLDDDALFFRFYKHTYDTVKRLCPEIQFGSPSMLYIENLGNADWIYRFIGWCREQSCMPDFYEYSIIMQISSFQPPVMIFSLPKLQPPVSRRPPMTSAFSSAESKRFLKHWVSRINRLYD